MARRFLTMLAKDRIEPIEAQPLLYALVCIINDEVRGNMAKPRSTLTPWLNRFPLRRLILGRPMPLTSNLFTQTLYYIDRNSTKTHTTV